MIRPGEVHLWQTGLDRAPERYRAALSPDERERAARFRFEKDRDRFVVGRGWLRQVLGGYLGCGPEAVQFSYGSSGKPYVEGPLQFNLAHSGDRALLAVVRDAAVGVDVELVEPLPELEAIARQYFTPAEREALNALPVSERLAAFYRCWTRKEALLKALGTGLSESLEVPGEGWQRYQLEPGPGLVGAVALPHGNWRFIPL